MSALRCDTLVDPENIGSTIERATEDYLKIKRFLLGQSKVTTKNCEKFIDDCVRRQGRPKILIIGSGVRGAGTSELWGDKRLFRLGVDVYPTDTVDVICDAHYLPFPDGSFDGVWIQAVLEHVVEPQKVVKEIHRVLTHDGIVYAETPFMQHVHD
ncbi:class I SAM-dependent methyltransferase [Ovoidimarina sediminis]|uniref:class I SAM-dependent methyltransferase n=1 Tax=Ovoidimarina sediminis TaxID=3079856 RepID=UPI002906C866|nr:class I SAM-dependent methyltransferase [Rhodophyticola sp. MJ-SS7]MDU8945529.1 class I SAM-dependent methyltransferase [Rhodophyticola sp. MJ-SS7]